VSAFSSLFDADSRYIYPPPDRPFLIVEGFKFCAALNKATFFTDTVIDFPSGPSPLSHGNAAEFTALVDYTARKLLERRDRREYMREVRVTPTYQGDFAARGMCFTLVMGSLEPNDDFVSLIWEGGEDFEEQEDLKGQGTREKGPTGPLGRRLLRTIDAQITFPFLNFDGIPKPSPSPQPTVLPPPADYSPSLSPPTKEHYKIAYVLLVHDKLDNVAALLDALLGNNSNLNSSSSDAFIYIHVDYSAGPSFLQSLNSLVLGRQNVLVMQTRFTVSWGHISILWAQIRAFFDLLDLISFDYVVNLSGSDYPLKSANAIWQHLERRPGGNWIYWNTGGWQIDHRLERMFHCVASEGIICAFDQNPRDWRPWDGIEDLFQHKYKGSQWIILHSSAVSYLRQSERTRILLTWAEHTLCPDEMILPIFFAASPFVNKTYRDPKRLMRWNGGLHPVDWTAQDGEDIEYWQKHFCWIRKVDVVKDKELKALLDGIRERDEMDDSAVADFKWGVVPVD